MQWLLTRKFWWRLIKWLIILPIVLFLLLLLVVYWKQEAIVQYFLREANRSYKGEIVIKGSHISPFAHFPSISIDLEGVEVYEDKSRTGEPILKVRDVYLNFDVWSILSGEYNVSSIDIMDGDLRLVQHKDGSFNIMNALLPLQTDSVGVDSAKTDDAPFHLQLDGLHLVDIDVHKINEATNMEVELFVHDALSRFSTKNEHLMIGLHSRFQLNILQDGDTTMIRHKNFDVSMQLEYDGKAQFLTLHKSSVQLEKSLFMMSGTVDILKEIFVDLKIRGEKPNFDMFIALAPEELAPTLKSYGNRGKIFFEADIKGETLNGKMPFIEARFGCENGRVVNNRNNKKLDELGFNGYFTNGSKRDLSTMEFRLTDFRAKPDAGVFSGDLRVRNFLSPDIDLKLHSEFNLQFLATFFNVRDLENIDGSISLTMNFHDIIDLEHPERCIEKLNESYQTELLIKDLTVRSSNYYLPLKNFNLKAAMDGHRANIEYCRGEIGNSDISLTGFVSDLPAILHHTDDKIQCELEIVSKFLDLKELSYNDSLKKSSTEEQLTDLSLKLAFLSSARAFTESKNLPVGEFLIRDFHATPKFYPHKLHDFHADLFIQDEDIRLVDFSGEIDGSDFHFTGKAKHYDFWLRPVLQGDTELEFDLTSKHLRLEDLFSYGGENYVPKDYQHEDFRDLRLHGRVLLHFNEKGFYSSDMYLDQLSASMQIHNARFDKFKGRIHYEDEHVVIESLSGKIGRSDINVYLNYYLGDNPEVRKRDNFFSIKSHRLDLDQLLAYNPPPNSQKAATPADHEAVFNIFDVPFTDIRVEADIDHLNYHRYLIDRLHTRIRMQKNHYIYFDECQLHAAGGDVSLKGYFNGSNPKEIYLSPELIVEGIDLDKLLFKFENFGQDYILSDNLHGRITCNISGKIRMHADMTPILDQSDLDLVVEIVNGKLQNYKPLLALEDFFQDKNLNSIRFDTLSNEFIFRRGKITVPNMTINSTLGFIELSGEQDLDMNMTYYFRVPLKLVTQSAFQKLFKRKKEEVDLDKEDEIVYRDADKKIRYINLIYTATADSYKIALGRDKREKKRLRQLRRQEKAERKAAKKAEKQAPKTVN
jgi:hypothetical protein